MLIAESSDIVQICTAFFSLVGVVVLAYLGYLGTKIKTGQATVAAGQEKAAGKVEEAAAKVATVKTDLARTNEETSRKLDDLARVSADTHTLVNNNMGVQLRLNAAVTRRLADKTGDSEDVKAAELSARMLKEHEDKQRVVDDRRDA